MLLRRVELQNFRGVRDIDLSIDDTTVLIGENASGKSSVLTAVQTVLAPDAPDPVTPLTPEDAHRAFGGADGEAVRIALTFVEDGAPAWPADRAAPLQPAMRETADGRALLRVELVGRLDAGAMRQEWRFADSSGAETTPASPEQIDALRRCAPVVMLDPGSLPAPGRVAAAAGERRIEAEVAEIYRRITHQRTQLSREEIREAADIASDVARRMLSTIAGHDTPARAWLEEIASLRDIVAAGDDRRLAALLLGSGSRMLSLLALAGAALRSGDDDGGATPLLCVDTPEARLHPLSLAPLWHILELLPGQKIVTTNSGDLLASAPLASLRRLVRTRNGVAVGAIAPGSLDEESRRRITYHIRARRGGALFARCWLLVEGETEFWLLPELARTLGYDFAVEGVAVVEFAQCGVPPLIHVARDLGIEWRLLADNDRSGRGYADAARRSMGAPSEAGRIVTLDAGDIEEALWEAGYADVYRAAAYGGSTQPRGNEKPRTVIDMAIRAVSKPHLALRVVEEASRANAPAPPRAIVDLIEMAVEQARAATA